MSPSPHGVPAASSKHCAAKATGRHRQNPCHGMPARRHANGPPASDPGPQARLRRPGDRTCEVRALPDSGDWSHSATRSRCCRANCGFVLLHGGMVMQAFRIATAGTNNSDGTRAMNRTAKPRPWSGEVTRNSNALDLAPNIFKCRSPRRIAASLRQSAERTHRRKAPPYQSDMSMLNFYINRAGRNLPERQKGVLRRAKQELRKCFGKDE